MHTARERLTASILALSLPLLFGLFLPTRALAVDYPDVQLAAFWNSDEDLSDTLYMSANGVDFQQLSTPYPADGNYSDHVTGMPNYVHALHDPSLFYKNGTFWLASGYVQDQPGIGWRFVPMFGSSKDLVHWSYPNSGSPTNAGVTQLPEGTYDNGKYDTAGADAFADTDGTVWMVTTLGWYGANHGQPTNDTMHPYILKVTGLEPGADQASNPGAQPNASFGDLTPINLPVGGSNWLDPSLFKEGDTYYLSIKKDGITNQIYSTKDLNHAGDASAWTLVNANVVTGYEGPSLTKYQGQYFMYTDKLKDYPAGSADGTAGTFVTQSGNLWNGWGNTRRITTTNVQGRSIPNRHGTVITVTDPQAKAVIFAQRERAGYGAFEPGKNGWVQENGKTYWYDNGIRAVSKEVYDPASDAWYWFDADGTMAKDKDVYIPSGSKWVRYDENGHMRKGEDWRYGAWYWFDPTTGQMIKGFVYVPSNGGKWVFYDYTTGKMTYGLARIDNAWYYFDTVTGAMQKGNVYVPDWGSRHWFDPITGRG